MLSLRSVASRPRQVLLNEQQAANGDGGSTAGSGGAPTAAKAKQSKSATARFRKSLRALMTKAAPSLARCSASGGPVVRCVAHLRPHLGFLRRCLRLCPVILGRPPHPTLRLGLRLDPFGLRLGLLRLCLRVRPLRLGRPMLLSPLGLRRSESGGGGEGDFGARASLKRVV